MTSCVKDEKYKWYDGSIMQFGCGGGGCGVAYQYAMTKGLVEASTYPYVNMQNKEVRFSIF